MLSRSLFMLASGVTAAMITASASSAGFHLGARPRQLLYIEMDVSDFAKSRTFYETVLDLKELPGSNPDGKTKQSAMLSFSGGFDDSFLTISHALDARASRTQGRPRKLTFKVDDIAGIIERARAAGIKVREAPEPAHGLPGTLTATISDPDGVTIELVQFPDS